MIYVIQKYIVMALGHEFLPQPQSKHGCPGRRPWATFINSPTHKSRGRHYAICHGTERHESSTGKGGSIYRPGVKNWGISTRFRHRRRREKFLSTFFEIFGKFVNKNAIKSDFRCVVGRYISKISKNRRFWGKNTSTNFQEFWDTSTKVPTPTPTNIPGV